MLPQSFGISVCTCRTVTTGSDNLHESNGDRSIGFSVSAGSPNEFLATNTRTNVGKWSLFAIITAGHRHRHRRRRQLSPLGIAIKTERSGLRNPAIGIHDTHAYRECFDTDDWKRDISQDTGWTTIEKTTPIYYTRVTLIDDSKLKSGEFKTYRLSHHIISKVRFCTCACYFSLCSNYIILCA